MQYHVEDGLRERKKAETRLAIERAAVEIAHEQGYDAATTEAIAAKAGVSLRTFFNYFPSKDLAIVGQGLIRIDEERAQRILEESGTDLLSGIFRVAKACVAETDPSSELMRRRRRLIHENPPLFHPHVASDLEFDGWLAKVAADHLKTRPERRRLKGAATVEAEARLAVVMVSSVVHHHVRLAIEHDNDPALNETDVQRTLDLMSRMQRKDS